MSATMMNALLAVTCLYLSLPNTDGHGQMTDPPARSLVSNGNTDQGYPFDNLYNHLNCGGRSKQYGSVCNGRCGVCGDACDDPHPQHAAGGKFATGRITRTYSSGQIVDINVDVTMNHNGYMEFRLCPNNDVNRPVTHDCLNQHVLQLADGSGTRYSLTNSGSGLFVVPVRLPENLVCSQCVLQWKMHAANDWGVDPVNHTGCTGCGSRQEEFYGCSDIAITGGSGQVTVTLQTIPTSQPTNPTQTTNSQTPATGLTCYGTGLWAGNAYLDQWCTNHCNQGNCVTAFCACS